MGSIMTAIGSVYIYDAYRMYNTVAASLAADNPHYQALINVNTYIALFGAVTFALGVLSLVRKMGGLGRLERVNANNSATNN